MMNQQHQQTAPDRDAVCPRCLRPYAAPTLGQAASHEGLHLRTVSGHCCDCTLTAEIRQQFRGDIGRWAMLRWRAWGDLGNGYVPGRWLEPAGAAAAGPADDTIIPISRYLANIRLALDQCTKSIHALEVVMRHEEDLNHGLHG